MDFPESNRRPTLAEMLGSPSAGSQSASENRPKRRQTMAEMLRESPLAGNETSLVQAVDAAQAGAARKAAVAEGLPAPEAPAAAAPAEVVAPTVAPPSAGGNRYHLYMRIEGRWVWRCELRAATHSQGMQQVIDWLRPEHDAVPIRLEQDETPVPATV